MNSKPLGPFNPDEISDWFWAMIDAARGSREMLEAKLYKLEKEEIIRFHHEFLDAAVELTDGPFLEQLDESTSEDTLQDLAEWVVSQGKQFYIEVWKDPRRIADIDLRKGVTYSSVADNVFWERFGAGLPYINE